MAGKGKTTKAKTYKKRGVKTYDLRKTVKEEVKAYDSKKIETKVINVPFGAPASGVPIKNIDIKYNTLMYIAEDIFSLAKGTDNTSKLAATNRIGDQVNGKGFKVDIVFTIPNYIQAGSTPLAYFTPEMTLRIMIFRTAFGFPQLSYTQLFDTNYGNSAAFFTQTQPVNWDEGYIKEVLYDKCKKLKNNYSYPMSVAGSGDPLLPYNGMTYRFTKYFKIDKMIKYMDNQTTVANQNRTDKQYHMVIWTEQYNASQNPAIADGTIIGNFTGQIQAWFKDA